MSNQNRPEIRAYIGSTGSGKGVSVRAALAAEKPERLIIWDRMREHGQRAKVFEPGQLALMIKAMQAKNFRVAFYPGDSVEDLKRYADRFSVFCRAAKIAGNLTMLVEELQDLTRPQWSPADWSACCTQGRHHGLKIWATTQRPSKVDKDFLGNASLIRCMTLRTKSDKATMADFLDVPVAQVSELQTTRTGLVTKIMYIERDYSAGSIKSDTITLRKK